MKYLSQDQKEYTLKILFEAEKITKQYIDLVPEERCLILNNIGCCYRRMGQLKKALNKLQEAKQLQEQK